ncbi:MAG TPA: NAD(P)H-dependent oxidoreductase subunit E [Bacteroidales bacterium]|nr:NAD(P)H-dependent oxidoreductase subunit E [Bacteroidales bacterium]
MAKYPPEKSYLLMILHDVQRSSTRNYISEEAMHAVATYLNMPMSSIYGVVTYYSMLSLKPRGKYVIRVCASPVCALMQRQNMLEWLQQRLKIEKGATTPDGLFTVEAAECLGRCGNAPSVMINSDTYTNVDVARMELLLKELSQ